MQSDSKFEGVLSGPFSQRVSLVPKWWVSLIIAATTAVAILLVLRLRVDISECTYRTVFYHQGNRDVYHSVDETGVLSWDKQNGKMVCTVGRDVGAPYVRPIKGKKNAKPGARSSAGQ